jgi:hypothetical protein
MPAARRPLLSRVVAAGTTLLLAAAGVVAFSAPASAAAGATNVTVSPTPAPPGVPVTLSWECPASYGGGDAAVNVSAFALSSGGSYIPVADGLVGDPVPGRDTWRYTTTYTFTAPPDAAVLCSIQRASDGGATTQVRTVVTIPYGSQLALDPAFLSGPTSMPLIARLNHPASGRFDFRTAPTAPPFQTVTGVDIQEAVITLPWPVQAGTQGVLVSFTPDDPLSFTGFTNEWLAMDLSRAEPAVGPTSPVPTTWGLGNAPTVFFQVSGFPAVSPSGNVQFFVDDVVVGNPVAVQGLDTTPFSLSALGMGDHTLRLVYSGDATYDSAEWTQQVEVVPTPIALTQTSFTVTEDDPNFTLTIAPDRSGTLSVARDPGGTPFASAYLTDGGDTLVVPLPADRVPGTSTFYATFVPNNTVNNQGFENVPVTVELAKLVSVPFFDGPTSWTYGQSLPSVLRLPLVDGHVPTGTVRIRVEGHTTEPLSLGPDGTLPADTANTDAGTSTLEVLYSGDDWFAPSEGTITTSVAKATPVVAVTGASGTALEGGEVVVDVSGMRTVDGGTIELRDGGTLVGRGHVSAGAGTVPVSGLAAGVHELQLQFFPDRDRNYEVPAPVTARIVVADPAELTTTIGTPAALSLRALPGGVAGTVQVYDGDRLIAGGPVDADGLVALTLPVFADGEHVLRVVVTADGGSEPVAYDVRLLVSGIPPMDGDTPTDGTAVALSAQSITTGGTVDLIASGFVPGETVVFVLRSDPYVLGTAVADASGVATLPALVPAWIAPGAHTVYAIGGTSGRWNTAPLQVTAPASADGTGTSAAARSAALAATGSGEVAPLVWTAVALVVLGGLVAIRRRRRVQS